MKKVKQIFEELQTTSAKTGKEKILADNIGNQLVKETLLFLLNLYIVTGLSNKKMSKEVSTSPTKSFCSAKDVMTYLTENNTGSDEIIANVQYYIAQQPCDMHDFYRALFTKSLKLGCAANTVNKVYGKGFIPHFEVQLAEKYFEHTNKVEGKTFTITKKLDGIRALVVKDGNNISIFSRQGQPIEGLVDLENELREHYVSSFVLDGELLITDTCGLLSKDQYKATTKIVRKDGEKHGITFRAFDFLHVEEFKTQTCNTPYSIRREVLEKMFCKSKYIVVLPVLYSGYDTSRIISILDQVRADGEEGIMINLNDAPYEFKRTQNLLKVKVMQDVDLRITGFEEGSGRLSGTLGRINVDYKGNVLGVGTGLSDEQRAYFWSNQNDLIGCVIKVKYFEETQDKNGKLSLRFPVFVELREEGKEVSYS